MDIELNILKNYFKNKKDEDMLELVANLEKEITVTQQFNYKAATGLRLANTCLHPVDCVSTVQATLKELAKIK